MLPTLTPSFFLFSPLLSVKESQYMAPERAFNTSVIRMPSARCRSISDLRKKPELMTNLTPNQPDKFDRLSDRSPPGYHALPIEGMVQGLRAQSTPSLPLPFLKFGRGRGWRLVKVNRSAVPMAGRPCTPLQHRTNSPNSPCSWCWQIRRWLTGRL
jgi:hypothetical protein